ncbi:Rft protein-domain-containing protein [Flammula alnicola]|nr:Rft protein-domain-containing protein [Flammula alnicola]
MNLTFLPILLAIPLALCTSILYARFASQEMKRQPHFGSSITLYALAAVTELLSEPLYNVAMVELKTGVRVRSEGLGITSKSITTFLILLYDSKKGRGDLALVAFAFGQLMYSLVMFATYIVYLGAGYMRPKLPSAAGNTVLAYIDQEALHLSFTMTLQSLVKHFLTEGDKMILSWFSPLRDQGGYAIAVNYGSLIARIVFQPIEETLRVFFSRILGGGAKEKESEEQKTSLRQSAETLRSLLSIQTSMSVILLVFGSAYLPILLPLLLPAQYLSTSAPSVLAAWVWYIPVLAINGGLEAFLSSVATPQDLNQQSRWMIGFSVIYIASAIFLYRAGLGDASLVYANIVNLSVRIAYCLHFVTRFFSRSKPSQRFRWQDSLPSWGLCVVTALSFLLLRFSETRLSAIAIATRRGRAALLDPSVIIHVGVGVVLTLICLLTWWQTSGRYLNLSLRRNKVE